MVSRQTPERNEAVEQAMRHWDSRAGSQAAEAPVSTHLPPAFTIAISRQAGANAQAIAQAVGERLGWLMYDRELVEAIAHEMGLRTKLVESVDERRANWLQRCLQVFKRPDITEAEYIHHLDEVLLALAAHGE